MMFVIAKAMPPNHSSFSTMKMISEKTVCINLQKYIYMIFIKAKGMLPDPSHLFSNENDQRPDCLHSFAHLVYMICIIAKGMLPNLSGFSTMNKIRDQTVCTFSHQLNIFKTSVVSLCAQKLAA